MNWICLETDGVVDGVVCGKTGPQQLRQCGNTVNSISGRVAILIQVIFLCVQRVVWEDIVTLCMYVLLRFCGCLRSNVVTEVAHCGLKGKAALYQHHQHSETHCSEQTICICYCSY